MNKSSFEDDLQRAADSLDAFATGPAQAAADALGDAFAKAGKRVSSSLAEAARSGELSVRSLAASLVRDLSNLALERFVTKPLGQIMPGSGAQPINITIHMAPGSNLAEVKRSSTQVAAALARAVQRGGSLL